MNWFTKKRIVIGLIALLLVTIPLTISLSQQQQNPRGKAAASSSLSFTPVSTVTNPLVKNVGDTIALDMMVNPGSNLVSIVRFQITYDPTKLEIIQATPFTINAAAFPTNIEGPVLGTGSVAQSLSIGADPTKVIQTTTRVGTLNFKAKAGTGTTPTTVTFANLTQVLSAGENDQASENVLSTTSPAYITIAGSTATPSASVQPTGKSTTLNFTILLHGIGTSGDNPNPSGSSLSNKNPLHPQRNLRIEIYDSNNTLVGKKEGSLLYQEGKGNFAATVDLGPTFPTGEYIIKVQTDRYLRRLLPGIQSIKTLQDNKLATVDLVAGDVNDDNFLNVLDYNTFLDCGYGELEPLPMIDPNAKYNTTECKAHTPVINVDVDDNGIINSPDYNLFLRELSVQHGD
ncbi:MAG: cohesin domain-containing protein [Patescibacteria group bacterium]